jgi:hypothetical protein
MTGFIIMMFIVPLAIIAAALLLARGEAKDGRHG